MKRRNFIKTLCAGSLVGASLPLSLQAKESKILHGKNKLDLKNAIKTITNGKQVITSDAVQLSVPEIAENGAVVPVKVNVDSPMTSTNYVQSIHILASKNSNARCAGVHLTPLNGKGYFSTRIKLNGTQDVVVIVQKSNGEFLTASKSVKVTIGGCG